MMAIRHISYLLAIALVTVLSACNSGGSTNVAEGGIGGTGITTSGQITAFGSIWVNGIEFETDSASIFVEGTEEFGDDQDHLDECMVVTVVGTVNADGVSGTADVVRFADEMEGTVDANNVAASNTLTVMSQTVTVTASTCFEDDSGASIASLADIPVNAVVEVSGFSDGQGNIVATRVEVKAGAWTGEELELKGVVDNLNTGAETFEIGALIIDYSSADLSELGATPLTNGLYVEVESESAIVGGVMDADEVELEDEDGEWGHDGDDGEEYELEGVINTIINSEQIEVNGQLVDISESPDYEGAISVICLPERL
ncbi:DUF5666 domain-containing protein [Candidatus Reidiella endopervernicosa]|uniref:DUF5666 domain-containing protein n=1 Tax=Candidatus Reidiella endopervernicosa TaxID=2738883 RepID=A0A6N0HU20_9GAMM|nr:DUF5666 domain-containing protein [Candidatus Reidiella endopervernicosa]QKQ25894.1 hypothetical protein HUE57_06065 [Candidatus Reidiella endopervernicosa]